MEVVLLYALIIVLGLAGYASRLAYEARRLRAERDKLAARLRVYELEYGEE